MRKNQTYSHYSNQKPNSYNFHPQKQKNFQQKGQNMQLFNSYPHLTLTEEQNIHQSKLKYNRPKRPSIQNALQVNTLINEEQIEKKIYAIKTENQKLRYQKNSLLFKNQQLMKKIEQYENKFFDQENQQTVKQEINYKPYSYTHGNTNNASKNITMIRSQQLNNQKFYRKNQSFYDFDKTSQKYKNYSNTNFVSPSKQMKFDAQLQRLRNQKMTVLSSLAHKSNHSRTQSQASLDINHENLEEQSKIAYKIKVSQHDFNNKSFQKSNCKQGQKGISYYEQSMLTDLKQTQIPSSWKQLNSCDHNTSIISKNTKCNVNQSRQKGGEKYVIMKCCSCQNCASDHIPTMKNVTKSHKNLKQFCQKQSFTKFINEQKTNLRITPPKNAFKKFSNKLGDNEEKNSNNQLISSNKTLMIPKSKQQKIDMSNFIQGDRYIKSCLDMMKTPTKVVKDLDKKIKQVKNQNKKLRNQILHQ